jgi:hypothetical protein
MPSQRLVETKKIWPNERSMHHTPWEYPGVEWRWRQRPGPRAHDRERANALQRNP